MKILIVTGGKIELDFALQFLMENTFECIIAADRGMELLERLSIIPDYLVGDFDSVSEDVLKKAKQNTGKVIKFNPVKDFTDTEAAVRLAIELGAGEITILGATGTRMDHVLANINTLFIALDKNIPAYIIDGNNRIRLINKSCEILKNQNLYSNIISLIPYTDKAEGVTLTGFYYPLKNKTLSRFAEPSLGVSNILTEDKGIIELASGVLIVIEARD